MIDPPLVVAGQRVVSGPEKARGEHRWRIALADGRAAMLAQQLPELADDESLRRRYVYESERRGSLDIPGLAEQLAMGPEPDPRDPGAEPPWRVRLDPEGERLDEWLDRRAPVPIDEAFELIANLAEVVHGAHAVGLVLRDLEPRAVVLAANGRLWLTDIGFARVDILSTRTASSLMLESSPYAAPEHLRATTIDHRADLYTLGAILWHALTGAVPFPSGPALFRKSDDLPALTTLCSGLPERFSAFVHACLSDAPADRPDSARDVAETLRGRDYAGDTRLALVTCQSCAKPLRPGLRLCLSCGKEAIQFKHAEDDYDGIRYELLLSKAKEDLEFTAKLREFFETLGEGPAPELNFVIGDARMYSKEERERRLKLPATLFSNLEKSTADDLVAKMSAQGFKVTLKRMDRNIRSRKRAGRWLAGGVASTIGGGVLLGTGAFPLGIMLLVIGIPTALIAGVIRLRRPKLLPPALQELRKTPAALPASDPLVARIAALMQADPADDVRAQLSETALLVQRVCDRRAARDEDIEFSRLIEPVTPLVDIVEREVQAIMTCDGALQDLDEGVLVRAIATAEARGRDSGTREELLAGLDRLRSLEDERAQHMQRLLEASSLMRRTVELGLSAEDEAGDEDRAFQRALAQIEADL